MSKAAKVEAIPNQVFIGLPFKTVKPKYDGHIARLRDECPLSLVIVGNDGKQDAEDLLTLIKTNLRSSQSAIFDVTGGNANVALEYGLAEAWEIPNTLYMSTHKGSQRRADKAIIADLAGKRRKEYKTLGALGKLLDQYVALHSYTVRFEKVAKKYSGRSKTKKFRAHWLCVLRQLDGNRSVRRSDIVENVRAAGFSLAEVEVALKAMHDSGLLEIGRGQYSTVVVG